MTRMKALSLTAPWGLFCVTNWKQNETRSWYTKFTGRLAIHQSKTFPSWARQLAKEDPFFQEALRALGLTVAELPLGMVLGAVDVLGCEKITPFNKPSSPAECAFGDYTPGRYMLKLANPVRLETPVPASGVLGLWDFEHPVVDYLLGAGPESSSPPVEVNLTLPLF